MLSREVLTNLVQASRILGTDAGRQSKWEVMPAKVWPYVIEPDGVLKK